ncbi:chemotaxis protein CheX [Natranaerovirga hydrolytica]|uniref:Chemotaxis protein CheX n=1 Tax=Natranaerovirga hydrolytica TaxID=680378 RepID=A0A4R1MDD0_9FIRM|nr:chemotaxis protein CheX [Natranaerovirga hydrolytica]TCK89034.1 chemotaxis protein CheX [Natranaerovirga hydrolytica]
MTTINVEHINAFINAAKNILNDVCQIEIATEKPFLKSPVYAKDTLVIIIGVTGQIKGSVMIGLDETVCFDIASKMMMGMPVTELNDMTKSAISELANMILGNAATSFSNKGIIIDITPPSIVFGNMSIESNAIKNICVPLSYEDKNIELNVAIKEG